MGVKLGLHGQRVFENRVLREIFGVMSKGETGNWRKLHCKRRFDLYFSVNISRVIKLMENGRTMLHAWEKDKCVQSFGGET